VVVEGTAVWGQVVSFVFGESFCQVAVFLGNLGRSFPCGIEGSEKFGERKDRIDMEDVDLVVGTNVAGQADLGAWRWWWS